MRCKPRTSKNSAHIIGSEVSTKDRVRLMVRSAEHEVWGPLSPIGQPLMGRDCTLWPD
jgi:hypothetical protein